MQDPTDKPRKTQANEYRRSLHMFQPQHINSGHSSQTCYIQHHIIGSYLSQTNNNGNRCNNNKQKTGGYKGSKTPT